MNMLREAVSERQTLVKSYLMSHIPQFLHPHLQAAITSYIQAGGKSLRPGVLMFSCGAVGGDESLAIPAAAAVELYHTGH
ncbi:MAG: polyprenyl synthetase family protein, partial [Anaerolineae bacterium]|nr:polyprenyl synthetase family protein [Anaerolineae bacterium]